MLRPRISDSILKSDHAEHIDWAPQSIFMILAPCFLSLQTQKCQSKDGRLELSWWDFRGGAYPLHHGGKDLADHPLHLPHAGAWGGSGGCVERRTGWLHLQHRAAWLPQRVLWQSLPHFPHPFLGAAGHFCFFTLAGVHGPCSLPPPSPRKRTAAQKIGTETWTRGRGCRDGWSAT